MEVLRLVLLFIECMKIKITKEMSENCRVYCLYLITVIRYGVLNTPLIKKKKNRRMRILGACISSKFFGGKITPF